MQNKYYVLSLTPRQTVFGADVFECDNENEALSLMFERCFKQQPDAHPDDFELFKQNATVTKVFDAQETKREFALELLRNNRGEAFYFPPDYIDRNAVGDNLVRHIENNEDIIDIVINNIIPLTLDDVIDEFLANVEQQNNSEYGLDANDYFAYDKDRDEVIVWSYNPDGNDGLGLIEIHHLPVDYLTTLAKNMPGDAFFDATIGNAFNCPTYLADFGTECFEDALYGLLRADVCDADLQASIDALLTQNGRRIW